jgi:hypothetical protein
VEYSPDSFERDLKILEEKLAIKRDKRGYKDSYIISDIKRIRSLLLDKKVNEFHDADMNITEEEIGPNIWSEIVEEGARIAVDNEFRNLNKNSDPLSPIIYRSHSVMLELIGKTASFLESRLFEVYKAHQDANFQIDEKIMMDLGKSAHEIASKNPKARFKLIIEYKGAPERDEKLGEIFGPSFFPLLSKYFLKWIQIFYDVSEEDRKNLDAYNIHLLSQTARSYFDLFRKTCRYYVDLWSRSIKRKM